MNKTWEQKFQNKSMVNKINFYDVDVLMYCSLLTKKQEYTSANSRRQ
jgi:hypothetical protein